MKQEHYFYDIDDITVLDFTFWITLLNNKVIEFMLLFVHLYENQISLSFFYCLEIQILSWLLNMMKK